MIVDKIIEIEQNFADVGFRFGDALYNNIWYSIQVKKGSMFYDLNFGSRVHLLRQSSKMTNNTMQMAKEYIKEALQWLIDIERIKSFLTEVSQNYNNKSRLDITITALRSDNEQVTYKTWYDLV